MQLAKVVGKIWATAKAETLTGYKLLQVCLLQDEPETLIAADSLDAGIGEIVLLTGGSAARVCESSHSLPIDATVIAIIDEKKLNERNPV